MSCFNVYRNNNGQVDNPKALGTLSDDASGNTCILPRSLIKLYSDRVDGASNFLSINDCTLANVNTRETTQLQQSIAGCHISLSSNNRDDVAKTLDSLQTVYDKNVTDRILELTTKRNAVKAAYETTLSNFSSLESNLTSILNSYYAAVTESNELSRDKKQLQHDEKVLLNELDTLKAEIPKRRLEADKTTAWLNSTVDEADSNLNFVCVCQHCDYGGDQATMFPGVYSKMPNIAGVSAFVIPPGMRVTIWEQNNYGGKHAVLTNNTPAKKCLLHLDKYVQVPTFRKNHLGKFEIGYDSKKSSFNDNVKSAEVAKIASVADFIDKWDKQL